MNQSKPFAKLRSLADCRACVLIVGFVYSPLLLLLGTAAVIGLG